MEIQAKVKYKDGTVKEYIAMQEDKMKKVFLESNGYNMIGFIFEDGMVAFDCETIEEAKAMDCSGVEGCETAEEAATNCNTEVYQFSESEWEKVTEI